MEIKNVRPSFDTLFETQAKASSNSSAESFGGFLKSAIDSVNETQIKADEEITKFVTGQTPDIHEALIAGEEARIQMELIVQIRNKIMDSYQEVMRMQI